MSTKLALLFCGTMLFSISALAATDEYIKVEIKGILHDDARSHRASVQANGYIFDLDFGSDNRMYDRIRRYDNSTVMATGYLHFDESTKAFPRLWIDADRVTELQPANVHFETRREEPVRERIIIREKEPLFKAGPLEIK